MLARKPGDKCIYKGTEVTIKKTVEDHSNGNEYYELDNVAHPVRENELTDIVVEKKKFRK